MTTINPKPLYFWFSERSSAGLTYMMIFFVATEEIKASCHFKPFHKKEDAYNQCVQLNYMLGWLPQDFEAIIKKIDAKINSMS